ncbi:hypothetical protein [Formosa algae]|uniref:Uncharacterized protein n=1 Tax=Formosa algae TaxID=225843 RepID=A0A9X1C9D6_9FLAO|nr:hypothetical protein [Formosa algae]MBP1840003.1 hypothetical protein [Formosa algae]MDQ0335602.1 hypothetical protein [Formosa algae]OEI81832.1 hypothetical protein AST99_02120 [Formosa algae]
MQTLIHFFKSLIQACPYTLMGKHCKDVLKGKSKQQSTPKLKSIKQGMKMGRNIALVGVFCPFLWISVLSGASTDFIILNVIHSGIIVCLGLVVIGVNYLILYMHTRTVK